MPDDTQKPPKKVELNRIKSSVLSRSLSIARVGLGAGASLAGRGIAQLWENSQFRDEKWKAFFMAQAKKFSQEVGELKGSLMKAGQMLSMYGEHLFPPEVNAFLKTLQHDSPPIHWDQIHKILVRELGPEKLAKLEINQESLASASPGQVHRARVIATGEELALKVQYPGVEKAIDSDLRALKGFLTLMRVFPKDFDSEPVFAEVRQMLKQETDYFIEADLTEAYRKRLEGDDRFVVPRIHREFSSHHVLASSFEEGVRADSPEVQSLPEERRNQLAEDFLDLFFKELFLWHEVQTDPHAGNYRVRLGADRDRWVLLDFGATRRFDENFINAYTKMIGASVLNDIEEFHAAARELKFLRDTDDPKLRTAFEDFCFMIVEPFRDQVYDWRNSDLPQRSTKKVLEILRGFPWRTPPREIIFLDRKTGGVFLMMSLLKARIHGRKLILRYLDGRKGDAS